ncbi:MAG: asparaginase [Planctomycetota bacterium]
MFHGAMEDAVVPLVRVRRAGIEESLHRGAFVLVEGDRVVLARGDPRRVVFFRSTSKPLQALVGVTSGAADRFGFTDEELAIAAGSHSATGEQLAVVRRMLEKAGLGEGDLRCVGHYSITPEVAHLQHLETDAPPAIWSNCSGKHTLMLATAKHLGLATATYTEPDHPVQQTIRRHLATLGGVALDAVEIGIDGCGVPAFALPLERIARALARFGSPEGLPADLAGACRRVAAAMDAHPDRVGGPGRFDTDLMASCRHVLLAKAGAEGVHGWVAPERRLAFAVKVEDGHDRGYRLLVVEILERLGLYTAEEAAAVRERQCDPVVRNRLGEAVGRQEVVVEDLEALDAPHRV